MIQTLNKEGVYIVTLDSGKGNLLTDQDLIALIKLVDEAESLNEVKGILLTGTKHSFCTGLSWDNVLPETKEEQLNIKFALLDSLLIKLHSFSKILTVAINGHSIGAGFLMMLCADYVIIPNALKSKWGLPEIKIGLGLDQLMAQILTYSLSPILVKDILYSGEYMTPQQFVSLGLVEELDAENELIDACLCKMQAIIEQKYTSFVFIKKMLKRIQHKELTELHAAKCYQELTELCLNN